MSTRIVSSFDITEWEEAPYDAPPDGPRLARATVRKTFQGDLEGESSAEVLLCQADPADLQAGGGYIASDRFTGRLGKRRGTFVFQHGGLGGAGEAMRTFGHVVPGSGTGDLVGLRGQAQVSRDSDGSHTLSLDYDFGEDSAG